MQKFKEINHEYSYTNQVDNFHGEAWILTKTYVKISFN